MGANLSIRRSEGRLASDFVSEQSHKQLPFNYIDYCNIIKNNRACNYGLYRMSELEVEREQNTVSLLQQSRNLLPAVCD